MAITWITGMQNKFMRKILQRMGAYGHLYLITDHSDCGLFKIEPLN
jgi:hypothetical protein